MVRKRIENVSEIRGYIKARCKLGLTVKEIHSEIGSIYGDNKMSFATVYRWFKNLALVRNLLKMPLTLEGQNLPSHNVTSIKSSPSLQKMHVSRLDS